VFCAQAAARQMIEQGTGGKIVNLASVDGLRPGRGLTAYDASKGAVIMFTKSLALEVARHNIHVNAIAPGAVVTEGTTRLSEARRQEHGGAGPALEGFAVRIPLGRRAEPDDIAKVAVFLASSAADYMTGEVVVVDGGWLLN
jgi:2-deoxy-D-gluconate 3-dehydrogenase